MTDCGSSAEERRTNGGYKNAGKGAGATEEKEPARRQRCTGKAGASSRTPQAGREVAGDRRPGRNRRPGNKNSLQLQSAD